MKTVFFTLASARSGTLYLKGLFERNIPECACRHEPFFDWGNPAMFGPAIYDAHAGRLSRIRERLAKKRRYIERLPGKIYIESSHAFLKSAYSCALEFFPEMRLIHLVRNPLNVARSEAYREAWRRRVHAPFHFYNGDDGRRHFCWALTGNEEIFQEFRGEPLTLFQWYLLQWIEIENRAMRFLAENNLAGRCFTLHSPRDLNDPARLRALFEFFGLATRAAEISLGGRRNKSIGYKKLISEEDERRFRDIIERLPPRFLAIFEHEPYTQWDWSRALRPRAQSPELHAAG